jgi:hypothetical protein
MARHGMVCEVTACQLTSMRKLGVAKVQTLLKIVTFLSNE